MTEEDNSSAHDGLIESILDAAYAQLADRPFYVVAELLLNARERRNRS